MKIKLKADLYSKKQIEINAPINRVWEIQSDINSWPEWQKEISNASLNGNLKKGTTFDWKAKGMKINSKLESVKKEKEISWTGVSLGMLAEHVFYFEKKGNKTKVISEESLSGWFPKIIKFFAPKFLDKSLKKSLKSLKVKAEK